MEEEVADGAALEGYGAAAMEEDVPDGGEGDGAGAAVEVPVMLRSSSGEGGVMMDALSVGDFKMMVRATFPSAAKSPALRVTRCTNACYALRPCCCWADTLPYLVARMLTC
jgi:hypothetical protein